MNTKIIEAAKAAKLIDNEGNQFVYVDDANKNFLNALNHFIEILQSQSEPVAKIERNEAGQISMKQPDGNAFDMSKYIDCELFTHPPLSVSEHDNELLNAAKELVDLILHPSIEADESLPQLIRLQKAIANKGVE